MSKGTVHNELDKSLPNPQTLVAGTGEHHRAGQAGVSEWSAAPDLAVSPSVDHGQARRRQQGGQTIGLQVYLQVQ